MSIRYRRIMLTAAFTAMVDGVRNHAAEFMPGAAFCTANLTAELRTRLDGMPLTSVGAETMFARVKRRADRGGVATTLAWGECCAIATAP